MTTVPVTLVLTLDEAVFLTNLVGNLPTQSNAHPLWVKLVAQVQPHLPKPEAPDGEAP